MFMIPVSTKNTTMSLMAMMALMKPVAPGINNDNNHLIPASIN